jgi:hypothetical protein
MHSHNALMFKELDWVLKYHILELTWPHRQVIGSIPTMARHIFQAFPVWIYTQSNIKNIIFTWVHNTNTEKSLIYRKIILDSQITNKLLWFVLVKPNLLHINLCKYKTKHHFEIQVKTRREWVCDISLFYNFEN